jgi:hypothetical protein
VLSLQNLYDIDFPAESEKIRNDIAFAGEKTHDSPWHLARSRVHRVEIGLTFRDNEFGALQCGL